MTSKPHSRDFEIVQAYIAYRDGLPEEAGAALRRIEEQLETFLDAAWKFEHEMANGEFVHFGEFRRALVAASGTDRALYPAREPEAS